jgi:hypothetical protein
MPPCFCQSFDCQGVDRDVRTLKSHQRRDHVTLARNAREASDRVLDAQDQAIMSYIGTMALSDNISGPSNEHGGRFWGRAPPDPQDLNTMAENIPPHAPMASVSSSPLDRHSPPPTQPSRRTRTWELLLRLSEIERSVEELAYEVSTKLPRLENPTGDVHSPFPLKSLLVTSKSLQDDLDRVKSKAHSVVELRRTISEKLRSICDSLTKAKDTWAAGYCQNTSAVTVEAAGYDTSG